MNSIDNLREYVLTAPSICSTTRAILVGYIDGIELEVADMVPLPVDADGVPIHVGDVMSKGEVTCVRDCGKGWEVVLDNLYTYDAPSLRHHAPTVEDVLREFVERWHDAKRGERTFDYDALIAECAAKLQLKEG